MGVKVLARAALLVWAMTPIRGAMAQPTELSDCFGWTSASCFDIRAGVFLDSCSDGLRAYETFEGRVAWYPLRYVGPISVELQARAIPGTRFPLFVEIVTVKDHPPGLSYCDGPGRVLMEAHGSTNCEAWETRSPISLDRLIARGETYVIRAAFLGDSHVQFQSPYLGCIRVKPVVTEVSPMSWALVRVLFR